MSQQIRNETKRIKPKVLSDYDHKCHVCGYDCTPILVVHHVTPVSEGGDNSLDNLVVLCPNCHALVHKMISEIDKNDDIDYITMSRDVRIIDRWMTDNLDRDTENKLNSIIRGKK